MILDISICSFLKIIKNLGKFFKWFFYDKEKKFYLMKIEVFFKSFSFVDVEVFFYIYLIIWD